MPVARTQEQSDRMFESWRREHRQTPARLAAQPSPVQVGRCIAHFSPIVQAADWTAGALTFDEFGNFDSIALQSTVGNIYGIVPDANNSFRYQLLASDQKIINPWPFPMLPGIASNGYVFVENHPDAWIISGVSQLFVGTGGLATNSGTGASSGSFDLIAGGFDITNTFFGCTFAQLGSSGGTNNLIILTHKATDLWFDCSFSGCAQIKVSANNQAVATFNLWRNGLALLSQVWSSPKSTVEQSYRMTFGGRRLAQLSQNDQIKVTYSITGGGTLDDLGGSFGGPAINWCEVVLKPCLDTI